METITFDCNEDLFRGKRALHLVAAGGGPLALLHLLLVAGALVDAKDGVSLCESSCTDHPKCADHPRVRVGAHAQTIRNHSGSSRPHLRPCLATATTPTWLAAFLLPFLGWTLLPLRGQEKAACRGRPL